MRLNRFGVTLEDTGHLVAAMDIDYRKRGYCKWKLYDEGSVSKGKCMCEYNDPPNTYLKCYNEKNCDVTWRARE